MDNDIVILDHVSLIRTYCKYDVDLTIVFIWLVLSVWKCTKVITLRQCFSNLGSAKYLKKSLNRLAKITLGLHFAYIDLFRLG